MRLRIAALTLVLTSALAAGCSMPSARPLGPAPAPSGAEPGRSEPTALDLLLEQARAERRAGRLDAATTSVERALRIDPNDALLWIELGEIKAEEGDRAQAELMAQKALTLAGGNPSITARANRLID